MRTTLDLPDDLLKRAKIVAVQRGTTLKELIGAALEQELLTHSEHAPKARRTKFPIFPSSAPGALKLTNSILARHEAEEDSQRHGLTL
ncbi:MAG: hypothetical protein NPIRA05_04000 [Nitrospirales bacterium]|nr:MAG: hypothetical protein NPIRA05_04000 [Nitrospirales bacterium]